MHHGQILANNQALLLVVDFQQKLLAAFKEPDEILHNCIKLIKFAKILKLPIIWTEQYPKGLGQTTDNVRAELSHLKPVEKLSFSCFGDADFAGALSRHTAKQLIVCGIETHICVEQTVLDGIECGYQMHVIADACGSRKTQDHRAGLYKMDKAGAILTCAEMAMYEILARSDTAEFRETLKLVK
jgi:nicotinamidase-related amidase